LISITIPRTYSKEI